MPRASAKPPLPQTPFLTPLSRYLCRPCCPPNTVEYIQFSGGCDRILYLWDMAQDQVVAGEFSDEVAFFNLFITLWNCGRHDHSRVRHGKNGSAPPALVWAPGHCSPLILLSYGFAEKLITLCPQHTTPSVLNYMQLARAHLAVGNFNSSLECWKQRRTR